MMPDEKAKLLTLLDSESKWCQQSEARNSQGEPVPYDDDGAVAWDIVGALCRLFGWRRACQLFEQLHRHVAGPSLFRVRQNADIAAMSALFDFNDASDMTYERVFSTLEGMPVWHGGGNRGSGDSTQSVERVGGPAGHPRAAKGQGSNDEEDLCRQPRPSDHG